MCSLFASENTIEEASSEEILTQDSINSDDNTVLDEQSVLTKDASLDDLDEEDENDIDMNK